MATYQDLQAEIKKSVAVLTAGGTLLYPSDTMWGLGCDATNTEAVQKLLTIKGREPHKGLIVLIAHINDLAKYVREVPALAYDLIEFAEHPLTLVLDHGVKLSPLVLGQDQRVAIRLVRQGFCFQVLQAFNKPLVSTSANFAGQPGPANFLALSEDLKALADHTCPAYLEPKGKQKPSTIIQLAINGTIKFLRR